MTTLLSSSPRSDGQGNPLRAGLETNRISDPCNFVLFGASGDLAKRMLYPALYDLRVTDVLPSNFGIVGFSRSGFSDGDFREMVRSSIEQYSRSGAPSDPLWSEFAQRVSYVTGGFGDIEAYRQLRARIEENDERLGTSSNRLFYLSTPPHIFTTIVDQLEAAGLGPRENASGWTRIIVEKPFGLSLGEARSLQREITRSSTRNIFIESTTILAKSPCKISWPCVLPT